MNRKEFKNAMSGVQPSDKTIERIMDMAQSKKRIRIKRGLVTVLVIVAILAFGGITANAATDGAVAEYISDTVKVLVNGKETASSVTIDKNGDKHIKIEGKVTDGANEIVIKDEENGTEDVIRYDIQIEDDGVEWSGDAGYVVEADNFKEPTTSVQD